MENYWKYSLALYFIVRVLFWFNWEDSPVWATIWLINEKQLPMLCLLSIYPCIKERPLLLAGLAGILYMMVYGIIFQSTQWGKDITRVQVTGMFLVTCIIVFILSSLFRRKL